MDHRESNSEVRKELNKDGKLTLDTEIPTELLKSKRLIDRAEQQPYQMATQEDHESEKGCVARE